MYPGRSLRIFSMGYEGNQGTPLASRTYELPCHMFCTKKLMLLGTRSSVISMAYALQL